MKIERIFLALAILLLILKYAFVLPFIGSLLVLVFSSLSVILFFNGRNLFRDKESKNQKTLLPFIGPLLSAVPIGIMFKVMCWPGGPLLLSIILSGVATILVYTKQLRDKENEELKPSYKNLLTRCIVATSIAVLFFLIPTNTLIKIHFRNDPELARLTILVQENPGNETYSKELMEYRIKKGLNKR